jgi:phospholipid/cholesterol/gamma-HCH transport system permease protein
VGNMMILTGKTITATVRPPYPYGGEFISQFIFALQLCWFPMLISTVAFGFGAPGLQAANFLTLFGALDRLGGFFILASVREFAPFVTAVVVAGVAGTAITADLGARKIREELDALQVLGVDPIKNLVVPRFLSLMLITGLLDIYALLFGIAGGIFAELAYNAPLGGFFATLLNNASTTELWGSILKCTLFGALDRLGGFFVLASIREFAPWVDAMIVAGVAGTAITADLGARKIREELDALQVLGVDPVKNLVVPRFLALMLITGLLDIYALIFGIFGGVLAELVYHQDLAGFWATFFTNASVTDLWGSIVKTTLFGAIIAIVCCYKGMTASGGAAGVGRAVNEAVVIAFSGIWAFNYVFTQTLLATHPEILVIR